MSRHRRSSALRRTTSGTVSLGVALAAGLVLVAGPGTAPATAASSTTTDRSCTRGLCSQTFRSDGTWDEPYTGSILISAGGGAGGSSGDGSPGGAGRVINTTWKPQRSDHGIDITIGGAGQDADDQTGGAGGAGGGAAGGNGDGDGGTGGGGGGGLTLAKFEQSYLALAGGGGGGAGGVVNNKAARSTGGSGGLFGAGGSGGLGLGGCAAANGGAGTDTRGAGGAGGGGSRPQLSSVDEGRVGGFGGGGGGGTSEGAGGCGFAGSSAGRIATSGHTADGTKGGSGGYGAGASTCSGFGCLVSDNFAINGGGGGGAGRKGGGGGGAGLGNGGGAGGGGSSYVNESVFVGVTSVTDGGANPGAGYVTIVWRMPLPYPTVANATPSSDGPGTTLVIPVDVKGRVPGSGTAGTLSVSDEFGDTSTVGSCGPSGRAVPNGTAIVYCSVKPTVGTTYNIDFTPSEQYTNDSARDVQRTQVKVAVPKAASRTTLSVPAASGAGDQPTLQATVTSASQRPTGTVTFEYHSTKDDSWSYAGSATTVVGSDGRTASASTQSFPVPAASDKVRATYSGNAETAGSSATADVNVYASLLSLTPSATQLSYGDRLVLTATAPACTSGTVRFYAVDTSSPSYPRTQLGSASIGADHRAQIALTPSVGDLVVTAQSASACASLGDNTTPWQLVSTTKVPTTTTLDASVQGSSAQLSVRVATPYGNSYPSGDVSVGYRSPSGSGRVSGTLSSGRFDATLRDLPPGDLQFYASYAGSASYADSSDTAVARVERRDTTVSLSTTPSTAPFGGVVPVTATVTSGGTPVPYGSVSIAGLQTDVVDGVAQLDVPVSAEPGSSQTIAVSYLGTDTYAASAGSSTVRVTPAAVQLSAAETSPAYEGGSVHLSVTARTTTAAGRPAVSPGGSVSVRMAGSSESTAVPLGACDSCTVRGGTLDLPAPALGRHTYVVSYLDASGRTTADPVEIPVEVSPRTAVTFRGISSYQVDAGAPVTVAVAVQDSQGRIVDVSTGTLSLYDGTTQVASTQVGGRLTFTPTWTGSRSLEVRFSGDEAHLAASQTGFATVRADKILTFLSITATAGGQAVERRDTVAAGTPVTFTVTASAAGKDEVVPGTVQVQRSDRLDGDVSTIDLVNGTGSVTYDDLTPGSTVYVYPSYAGDQRYAASAGVFTILVGALAPRATMVSPGQSSYSVTAGQQATVPVTLTDNDGPVAGELKLYDGDTLLDTTSTGTFTFTPGWTGTRTLRIAYAGDDTHAASTGTVDVEVTAKPAGTLTNATPHRLAQGSTTTVTLTGTGFTDATTPGLSDTEGITLGSPTRVSATRLTVPVTVAADAPLRTRTWSVGGGGDSSVTCAAAKACGLTVVSAPSVTAVSPSTLTAGTEQRVTITGAGFLPGMTAVLSGSGVTLGAVTVDDAGHASVLVTVAATAPKGARKLTLVNTDGGRSVTSRAVTVRPARAAPTATALGTRRHVAGGR